MNKHSLDAVAEWFLRLNGFFTIPNFVIHTVTHEEGRQQRTDADVLGVRFPYRLEEVGGRSLVDFHIFNKKVTQLVIAEVKTRRCGLNAPWSRVKDQNVEHVLSSVGCVPSDELNKVATDLYEHGVFESDRLSVRLMCFGSVSSDSLPPGVLQLTWNKVLEFVYSRYQKSWPKMLEHQQWPAVGQYLWNTQLS